MTPLFVAEFVSQIKCANCLNIKAVGHSVCERHLTMARKRFRAWSKKRKSAGLCVRCDCKSYNGFLKCKKHTMENRAKCLAWWDRVGGHREAYLKRVALMEATGMCIRCNKRPIEGKRNCRKCKDKHSKARRMKAKLNKRKAL